MWRVQVEIETGRFDRGKFPLVMDGSFSQPLESTRLARTTNVSKWSPNNTTIRSSKNIPCVTKCREMTEGIRRVEFGNFSGTTTV